MKRESVPAYEVITQEKLGDISSEGWILRHKKTGARVMLIENDDENKVFAIAFRTTPSDSTGVPHIMEHSVLCGSKEFPLKDPFVELVKGSLNTFLNAITYRDKTCYPVASCNDQDFQNLMHVYLDAVFYPNIYSHEEIFRQEGWSYHLDQPEGPLTINGVVYNEMKGAFSDPDEVLDREIMNSLYPDTIYSFESGGDPQVIPKLTYEQFLDFHRKYYHPSNSFIYIYGNADMAEKLNFIDEHYLSRFEPMEVDSTIALQKPFEKVREFTLEYPISESEEEEEHSYLSWNMTVGTSEDSKLRTAFEVLDYALLNAPGAPLKKALLDAGIGKDIYGSFDDGIRQPLFSVVAKDTDPEKKQAFVDLIRQVLTEITQKGMDPLALEAGINYMEFHYREADFSSFPRGLMYGLDVMGTWLYEKGDPFASLKLLPVYQELRDSIGTGYFEGLIRTWLLDNPHGTVLTLVPSKGLAARREKKLEEDLEAYRASLSPEELDALVESTKALIAYQEAPEEPEALRSIPMLKREDIKREIIPYVNEPLDMDGNLFLYHDVATNGIGYVKLLFDLKDLSPDLIPWLGLFKSVLGYVDTENYTYGQLFHQINARTGGIQCGVEVLETVGSPDEFTAMFAVRGKALYSQMEVLFSMMEEILSSSKMEDTRRLYEIITQTRSRMEESMVSGGHHTSVQRASSYGSPISAFQEALGGIDAYRFIVGLEKEFDSRRQETVEKLREVMAAIFRPENYRVSYTGERESLEQVMALSASVKKILHTEPVESKGGKIVCVQKNEGFTTSGQVQYVARTGNFVRKGFAYTGALEILKVIMGYDYLWINLRVKGGAYGCMNGYRRDGEGFFVSYRDPHLKRTLDVFKGIPDYIRSFQADEREMTKYIIGTISNQDVPKTPKMKGSLSAAAYFSGLTDEMRQKERDQILDATPEDIRALAPLVEAILSEESLCVVGSETAIEKEKDLFYSVRPLIGG